MFRHTVLTPAQKRGDSGRVARKGLLVPHAATFNSGIWAAKGPTDRIDQISTEARFQMVSGGV